MVTPGYKITHGATVLVMGQHSHTFFLLLPTRGRQRIRFESIVSLKLGQGVTLRPKLFVGPLTDHLIPLRVQDTRFPGGTHISGSALAVTNPLDLSLSASGWFSENNMGLIALDLDIFTTVKKW